MVLSRSHIYVHLERIVHNVHPVRHARKSWVDFQVIQGFGTGWGMQMSSLRVQLELKDTPTLVPVGIALVMFIQYLGATIIQVIAGTVFSSVLASELQKVELTSMQHTALLGAGIKGIRTETERHFPELLGPILEAYNTAITTVFVSFDQGSNVSISLLTYTYHSLFHWQVPWRGFCVPWVSSGC